LLLLRAAMSQGAGRNRDRQQDECQEEFMHCVASHRFQPTRRLFVHGLACRHGAVLI
jgi:hypothetical protein